MHILFVKEHYKGVLLHPFRITFCSLVFLTGSATPSAITTDMKGSSSAVKQRQVPRPAINDSTSLPPGRKPSSTTTSKRTSDKAPTKVQSDRPVAKAQSDRPTAKHTSDRSMDQKNSVLQKPSSKAPTVKKSVNFQDMMKLAQKNIQEKATLSVSASVPSDRSSKKKSPSPLPPAKRSTGDKGGTGDKSQKAGFSRKEAGTTPATNTNGHVRSSKNAPMPPKSAISSKQSASAHSSLTKSKGAMSAKSQSAARGSIGANAKTQQSSLYSDREITLSKANSRTKRREDKVRQQRRPEQKSSAFYGAASKRLAMDGVPKFSTQRAPMKYTSGWVDEMAEFMQEEGGEDCDDDDDDDLDGFVVDDDNDEEYGSQQEYSSAIREIFGYDKRRYAYV